MIPTAAQLAQFLGEDAEVVPGLEAAIVAVARAAAFASGDGDPDELVSGPHFAGGATRIPRWRRYEEDATRFVAMGNAMMAALWSAGQAAAKPHATEESSQVPPVPPAYGGQIGRIERE